MKQRALIIDDVKTNLVVAGFLAEEANFEVVYANNGFEALEILESDQKGFSVILVDLKMPMMGGVDLLKRLQTKDDLNRIPTIVLSHQSKSTEVEQALKSGAVDYLVKPIDPKIFKTKIKQHAS